MNFDGFHMISSIFFQFSMDFAPSHVVFHVVLMKRGEEEVFLGVLGDSAVLLAEGVRWRTLAGAERLDLLPETRDTLNFGKQTPFKLHF